MSMPSSFLIFRLGQKKFGLDAGKVHEILQYDSLTRLADGQRMMEDVVVWRGNVLPVVDMRIRFNFGTPSYEEHTCIIILEVGGRYIGMAVDGASEVVKLIELEIRPLPANPAASCLLGVGAHAGENLILVDIDKLMPVTEVQASQKLS